VWGGSYAIYYGDKKNIISQSKKLILPRLLVYIELNQNDQQYTYYSSIYQKQKAFEEFAIIPLLFFYIFLKTI
jgi:hypothetical protein